MKSRILEIIKTHDNWREIIEYHNIKIKDKYPFVIFNYDSDADPIDPIVREARGIIIDLEQMVVACWPFTRFYNSYEAAAKDDLEKFDWGHCRVEEKVDGSIVKLFWNCYTENWQWATNSCIDANSANTFSDMTFAEIIKKAVNYTLIQFEALDRECTYIFELVSPFQQIVIRYPKTMLYHIGTRNNITGDEDWRHIGIVHPKVYHLHSLKDCIDAAQHLNANKDSIAEGFVVVDKSWRRLKVKSPEYVAAHRLVANRMVTKEHILDVIQNAPNTIDNICKDFPDLAMYYRYYQFKTLELSHDVQRFIDYVRGLYEEYNHDRKAVALTIKGMKFAPFGFGALNNDKDADTLIAELSRSRYLQLIDDFEERDVIHKSEEHDE